MIGIIQFIGNADVFKENSLEKQKVYTNSLFLSINDICHVFNLEK
jgi:hypothetical protein